MLEEKAKQMCAGGNWHGHLPEKQYLLLLPMQQQKYVDTQQVYNNLNRTKAEAGLGGGGGGGWGGIGGLGG